MSNLEAVIEPLASKAPESDREPRHWNGPGLPKALAVTPLSLFASW